MRHRHLIPLLALALAGCDASGATSPALEGSIFSLLGGLEPGEPLTLTGADARTLYLPGGANGAEFVVVPFHGAASATSSLDVDVSGENLGQFDAYAAGASPARSPAGERETGFGPLAGTLDAGTLLRSDAAHLRLRARHRRELGRRLERAAWRGQMGGRMQARFEGGVEAQAAPQVGELLTLNAQANEACTNPVYRAGRVKAVTTRAIVVADTLNPAGGFTDAEYRAIADEFDALVYPVGTRNFGAPSDIDANGRVLIFFTSAVNDLTPPNAGYVIGGFFYARDIFPRSWPEYNVDCPGSNEAEMFYLMVPDPDRAVQEPAFAKEYVQRRGIAIVGHEFQHLINASRRLWVNDADDWEDVWLDEALSHVAEELLFYEAAGLQPGRNIARGPLQGSANEAVNRFQVQNLLRYGSFLERPDTSTLFGFPDLANRGASWSFLRYVADHDTRDDQAFFYALVNTSRSGITNLGQVVGGNVMALARDWAVSVYADDAVQGLDGRLTQPSWNFRDILPLLYSDGQFPLEVRWLTSLSTERLTLAGGGTGYLRAAVGASRQASITTTTGAGGTPPSALSVSVIRVR